MHGTMPPLDSETIRNNIGGGETGGGAEGAGEREKNTSNTTVTSLGLVCVPASLVGIDNAVLVAVPAELLAVTVTLYTLLPNRFVTS